ncbi:glycosyltransferase [Pannus brasiliensis CCIBt3594]|uniref:Glycosyltransferase n=1 Tax=Pannus brasiliensis CCIBt3594 TaxID=1427578 RepID=A0AAW9QNW6_9CHRO
MKLMYFINGSEASAAGIRARSLARWLPPDWQIRFLYRSTPKWKSILPFLDAARQFRPDIIYVMDTAYTGVLAAYAAKKLFGCKFLTDTGDAAYELARSAGTYSRTQLTLIRAIEELATRESDYLIVRGSYHEDWLRKQGIEKVEFIPDGVDTGEVEPVDTTEFKRELGLEKARLVVGMVGTMEWSARHRMCYGWDIVEALTFLRDLPIHALLVGDGNGRAILEERARELGVSDRIVFTGRVRYEELPRYLSLMDACVSTQSNDRVGMVRTTGKLPLYLAFGKYVIATDVGEARRVLPGIGCLLPYEGVRDDTHPARLAARLREALDRPERLAVAEAARRVARENFDYPMLASRVEKVCRDLVRE